MDRRRFLQTCGQLSLVGAGWLGASAFISEQPAPSEWAPHRVESSDPLWPMLNGAALSYDAEKGVLKASFTDTIRSYHGKAFTIGGFYMPLDARPASAQRAGDQRHRRRGPRGAGHARAHERAPGVY